LRPRAEDPETRKLDNAVRIPDSTLREQKPLVLHAKVLRTWDLGSSMAHDQINVEGLACSFTYQLVPNPTDPKSQGTHTNGRGAQTVLKTIDVESASVPTKASATQLPFTTSSFAEQQQQPNNTSLILYAASGYLTSLFPSLACGVATCPSDDAERCITLLQRPYQTLSIGVNHANFSFFSVKAQFQNVEHLTIYPVSAKNEGALFSEAELSYSRSTNSTIHIFTTPSVLREESRSVSLLHVGFLARHLEVAL